MVFGDRTRSRAPIFLLPLPITGAARRWQVTRRTASCTTAEGSGRRRGADRRQLCRVWCPGAGGRKRRSSLSPSTDSSPCRATPRTLSFSVAPPHGCFRTMSRCGVGGGEDHRRPLGNWNK